MKPCNNDVMGTDNSLATRNSRCATCLVSNCSQRVAKGLPDSTSSSSALDVQIGGDHYKSFVIQPAEFITRNEIGFLEGCVIKRVCRYKSKTGAGAKDIRKAIHELQLLLELRYPGDAS